MGDELVRSFVDTAGREWNVDVTVATVKRVREGAGVLLTGLYENKCALLTQIGTDFELLVNVLWAACLPQAKQLAIGPEQFAESMGGDSLRLGMEALVRATADFFTSPEQRQTFQKLNDLVLGAAQETTNQAAVIATREMEAIDPAQLAKSYLDFVISGQESPASTQILEPLAN